MSWLWLVVARLERRVRVGEVDVHSSLRNWYYWSSELNEASNLLAGEECFLGVRVPSVLFSKHVICSGNLTFLFCPRRCVVNPYNRLTFGSFVNKSPRNAEILNMSFQDDFGVSTLVVF